MKRIPMIVCKMAILSLPVCGAVASVATRDAAAQYPAPPPPPPPPPGQYEQRPAPPPPQNIAPPAPPDAYIATTQPEYYEGHAVYWYNGSWYYRDERGSWNYYHTEPPALHDRRSHAPEPHRYKYNR